VRTRALRQARRRWPLELQCVAIAALKHEHITHEGATLANGEAHADPGQHGLGHHLHREPDVIGSITDTCNSGTEAEYL
jgi:hypothetical protein